MLRESFKLFIQNGHETHSNKQTNIYFHEKNNALTHSYVYRMGTALCGEDEEEEEEEDVTILENAEKM